LFRAGDQVSRRGALTGGYVDNRKSRLDLYIAKQDLQTQLAEKAQELAKNKEQQQQLEVCLICDGRVTRVFWLFSFWLVGRTSSSRSVFPNLFFG